MGMAICMVELTSIARGIETSDDMIKAAQVTLLRGTTVCPLSLPLQPPQNR